MQCHFTRFDVKNGGVFPVAVGEEPVVLGRGDLLGIEETSVAREHVAIRRISNVLVLKCTHRKRVILVKGEGEEVILGIGKEVVLSQGDILKFNLHKFHYKVENIYHGDVDDTDSDVDLETIRLLESSLLGDLAKVSEEVKSLKEHYQKDLKKISEENSENLKKISEENQENLKKISEENQENLKKIMEENQFNFKKISEEVESLKKKFQKEGKSMSELATPVLFPLPHRQSLPEWPDVATDVLVLGSVYSSKFKVVNSCINQMAFTNDEKKDSQYNYGKRKYGKHPLYKLTDEKSGTVYYLNNGDYFIHRTKCFENQCRAIKGVIQSPNRTKVVLNITIQLFDGSIRKWGNYRPQIERLNVYLENLKNYSLVVSLSKYGTEEGAFVHFTPYDAKIVEENLRNALVPPPSSVLVIVGHLQHSPLDLFPPLSLRSRLADFVKRGPTVKLLDQRRET